MKGRIVGHGEKTRYLLYRGGVQGWVEVSKAEFDRALPPVRNLGSTPNAPNVKRVGIRPTKCHPLAVNPRDREKAAAYAKKMGVPTEFDKRGVPIITSRDHQKRLLQIYGSESKLVNYDGGYGDG